MEKTRSIAHRLISIALYLACLISLVLPLAFWKDNNPSDLLSFYTEALVHPWLFIGFPFYLGALYIKGSNLGKYTTLSRVLLFLGSLFVWASLVIYAVQKPNDDILPPMALLSTALLILTPLYLFAAEIFFGEMLDRFIDEVILKERFRHTIESNRAMEICRVLQKSLLKNEISSIVHEDLVFNPAIENVSDLYYFYKLKRGTEPVAYFSCDDLDLTVGLVVFLDKTEITFGNNPTIVLYHASFPNTRQLITEIITTLELALSGQIFLLVSSYLEEEVVVIETCIALDPPLVLSTTAYPVEFDESTEKGTILVKNSTIEPKPINKNISYLNKYFSKTYPIKGRDLVQNNLEILQTPNLEKVLSFIEKEEPLQSSAVIETMAQTQLWMNLYQRADFWLSTIAYYLIALSIPQIRFYLFQTQYAPLFGAGAGVVSAVISAAIIAKTWIKYLLKKLAVRDELYSIAERSILAIPLNLSNSHTTSEVIKKIQRYHLEIEKIIKKSFKDSIQYECGGLDSKAWNLLYVSRDEKSMAQFREQVESSLLIPKKYWVS